MTTSIQAYWLDILYDKWYFQNSVALEMFRKTNEFFRSPYKEYLLLQAVFIFF